MLPFASRLLLLVWIALCSSQAALHGAPDEWEFDGNGGWTMRGDVLVLEKAGVPGGRIRRPGALAVRRGPPVGDVEFRVDVRSTAPADTCASAR